MAPRKKKDDLPVPAPLEEPEPKPKRKIKIIEEELKEKPKRKIKIIEEPKRKIDIIEEPKPKRKFKIIEEPVNIVVEEKTPCMVESGEPIKVGIVHKVVFQKLKHNSKNYYLDSERDKLYEFIAQNKHGKYIGRWDSHLEEIVTGEDSDEECV
jgi:hypothetical protein